MSQSELQRIACVEDDADIRSIVELSLANLGGFQIALYESGAQALENIEEFHPQLVILDMMMPGMDGLETLQRIRALPALSGVPAVFMTAKAQPNEIQRYENSGAIGVIVKPFDPISLATEVKTLWRSAA